MVKRELTSRTHQGKSGKKKSREQRGKKERRRLSIFSGRRLAAVTVGRWIPFIACFSLLSCLDGFESGPRFQFVGLKPEVSEASRRVWGVRSESNGKSQLDLEGVDGVQAFRRCKVNLLQSLVAS
ncbi:Uncharacterized protein Rs2_00098 [Raphanus sativus]|nr:Uncharacterized protein Rs2_00098 [Raphanus sativus]